jgi:hypothetical protein
MTLVAMIVGGLIVVGLAALAGRRSARRRLRSRGKPGNGAADVHDFRLPVDVAAFERRPFLGA